MKLSDAQFDVLQRMREGYSLVYVRRRRRRGRTLLTRDFRADIVVSWSTLGALLDKHAVNIVDKSQARTLFEMTEEAAAMLAEVRPF